MVDMVWLSAKLLAEKFQANQISWYSRAEDNILAPPLAHNKHIHNPLHILSQFSKN